MMGGSLERQRIVRGSEAAGLGTQEPTLPTLRKWKTGRGGGDWGWGWLELTN